MSDIALTVSVLALVAVVGLWIGNVKVRGVGFGIGGVLFGGIIVGHFVDQAGITLSSPMLHFIQEFGLILFVYTIGIQVGPGFFASLRVSGLDYFDLLLIHAPQPWTEFREGNHYYEGNLEAWRAMEEAYKAGKLRAVGQLLLGEARFVPKGTNR